MKEDIECADFSSLSYPDKLHFGVKTRLCLMSPYISYWPQAMLLGLKPVNMSTTITQLSAISDEICFQAGDKSTDMTWYTKRGLLLKTYLLTETHMLGDKSPDFKDTWEFLDRRIAEMEIAESIINHAPSFGGSIFTGLKSIINIASPTNLNMDDTIILNKQKN